MREARLPADRRLRDIHDLSTPLGHANRLARYITDPSTIVSYTKLEFGTSPSRELCAKLIEEHRRSRIVKPIWENKTVAKDGVGEDGIHYKVPGLVRLPRLVEPKPKPAPVAKEKQPKLPKAKAKPQYVPPEIAPDDLYSVRLLKLVASDFKIKPGDILGKDRRRRFIHARAVMIFILRERNPAVWSFPQIGKFLGGRDHSSIINLWRQRDDWLARYSDIATFYAKRKGDL